MIRRCLVVAVLAACDGAETASPSWRAGGATRDPREEDASAPPPARSAIHHVLSTGQSLAVGAGGEPALSLAQPFANRMFDRGVMPGGEDLLRFVPLVEATTETMSSSFANLVTQLSRARGPSHDLLVSVHGVSGAPYRLLEKGTPAYADGIAQVKAAIAIARERDLDYEVTAVTTAHGATDHVEKNARYAEDLAAWQRDYETDVNALTGKKRVIPLFQTQYSSFTIYDPTSSIPIAQLRAHVEGRGRVVVVAPRYPLIYGPDGVHLTNEGYRLLGEYHAKAYQRVVVEAGTWEPLRPKRVTRDGASITVEMIVPAPPLVLDTTLASDPGNMGFEYVDDGPTPAIAGVALAGPTTVTITLASEPTGANKRLRYAYTGALGAKAGLRSGARGNLRDSDATPSRHGFALFNWCVHFDEAVP
ncbi:MAG: hypothetical protein KF819_26255 [Labilithrix sp.]|nr:hypothetical protein [Labilithrix sp.]